MADSQVQIKRQHAKVEEMINSIHERTRPEWRRGWRGWGGWGEVSCMKGKFIKRVPRKKTMLVANLDPPCAPLFRPTWCVSTCSPDESLHSQVDIGQGCWTNEQSYWRNGVSTEHLPQTQITPQGMHFWYCVIVYLISPWKEQASCTQILAKRRTACKQPRYTDNLEQGTGL